MESNEEVERYLRYADAIATMTIDNGANEDNVVVSELLNAMFILRIEKKAPV